jgi:hypothetical protein
MEREPAWIELELGIRRRPKLGTPALRIHVAEWKKARWLNANETEFWAGVLERGIRLAQKAGRPTAPLRFSSLPGAERQHVEPLLPLDQAALVVAAMLSYVPALRQMEAARADAPAFARPAAPAAPVDLPGVRPGGPARPRSGRAVRGRDGRAEGPEAR